MKKILKILFFLNIGLVVITLLSYLSPVANPKVLWPISVMAVFYPWLLLTNLLFIIFWSVFKFRYILLSLITILIGYNNFVGFVGFSSPGYKSSPTDIELMTFNTQNLFYIFSDKEMVSENTNAFFEEMHHFDEIDILCTQEMGVRSNELMLKKAKFSYHYAPENIGPVIYSKHPIINKGQIHSSTSTVNSCVWADINISGKTHRIYNVHMQSNKITRTAEKVIKDSNFQNKETWSGIKSIIVRYKDNANYRIEHAERIKAHVANSPYPVIIAGDFNDVPQSYLYRIFARDFSDSFKKVGRGLGITFSGKIPALRIDYILADKNYHILNHEIIKNEFSDHYPIKSIVNLKP